MSNCHPRSTARPTTAIKQLDARLNASSDDSSRWLRPAPPDGGIGAWLLSFMCAWSLSRAAQQPRLNTGPNMRGPEGLGQIVVTPAAIPPPCFRARTLPDQHDGHVAQRRIGLIEKSACDLHPVGARHLPIEQDQVRVLEPGKAQRGLAVTCGHDAESVLLEGERKQTHDRRVIIGDENGMRTNLPRRLRRAGRCWRFAVAFDELQFLPFGRGENLESACGSAGAPATHLHDAIDRFVVAERIMVGESQSLGARATA